MVDNNNYPKYTKSIDDLPTQGEFIEKPYYDNYPSPPIQNTNTNYNDGAYYNNIQDISRNNNKKNCNNPRVVIVASIILIIVFIIDSISQIVNLYFNLLIFCDSVLNLFIGILFLSFILKGKSIQHFCCGFLVLIVWFGGFALRGIGIINMQDELGSSTSMIAIEVFAMIARTISLFCCFPYVCNTK